VIEVYKREHERAYGYYVLPLLAGDRFLGRADLKATAATACCTCGASTPSRACAGTSTRSSSARGRLARRARPGGGRTREVG
jgi:uncharacterized protein YcaQ